MKEMLNKICNNVGKVFVEIGKEVRNFWNDVVRDVRNSYERTMKMNRWMDMKLAGFRHMFTVLFIIVFLFAMEHDSVHWLKVGHELKNVWLTIEWTIPMNMLRSMFTLMNIFMEAFIVTLKSLMADKTYSILLLSSLLYVACTELARWRAMSFIPVWANKREVEKVKNAEKAYAEALSHVTIQS